MDGLRKPLAGRLGHRVVALALVATAATASPQLPANFTDELVLGGLGQPMALAFLADGRMLIAQKSGAIFIADSQATPVSAAPYMGITDTNADGERGILNIVLDPHFESDPHFYLLHTQDSPARMRISRFDHLEVSGGLTSQGFNGSQLVLWEDTHDYQDCCHYGGGLAFGPDDALYATIGDQGTASWSQDLTRSAGSVIRVNTDGTIPADNPFLDGPGGNDDAIWAFGLRNPFRATWDLVDERFYIGEVGGNDQATASEDVHVGALGANYGWPDCEGPAGNPNFPTCDALVHSDPIFNYFHAGAGAGIIGGVVYRGSAFPSSPYYGAYFYADYIRGFIRYLTFDAAGDVSGDFAFSTAAAPTSLTVGTDGALYYTTLPGQVRRIVYDDGNQPPVITFAATDATSGQAPLSIDFTSAATDPEMDPLTYLWDFGDGNTAPGPDIDHTYTANGAYQARLYVSDPTHTTSSEPIEITVGSPPTAAITTPVGGSTFRAGELISFSGTATHATQTLDGSNMSWQVQFIHNEHLHPVLGPQSGASGSFTIPSAGHDFSDETGYRITLTVTDLDGLSDTTSVDIFPEKVELVITTVPAGLTVFVDDLPRVTPFVLDTLIDFEHELEAPLDQCALCAQQTFASWSQGGAAEQTLVVPDTNTTLIASYTTGGACPLPSVVPALVFRVEGGAGLNVSGNDVVSWDDQSGSLNDLTIVSGSPVVSSGALNGHDAVVFDGVDDAMGRTGFTGLPTGADARSVFMVVRYDSGGWGGFTWGENSANRAFGLTVGPLGALGVRGVGSDFESSAAAMSEGWLIQSIVYDGSSFTHYKDGVAIDTQTHTFDTGSTSIRLGTDIDEVERVDMSVAEILVFDGALTPTEHLAVELYLEDKYFGGPCPLNEAFCSGDGGDQLGCTDCPCANNAPQGTLGGCLNGVGASANLYAQGSASLSNETLRLEMTGGNPSTFGVLVSGDNRLPNAGACPPGSGLASPLLDGLRCVGGAALRHGPRATDPNGEIGTTSTAGWGPPNGPAPGIGQHAGFSTGQTRHFQVFYRENDTLVCLRGQNTSNAVSITFLP